MDDDSDPILLEFLEAFVADRNRGVTRPLAEYLARYPGHEDAIAREYLELTGPRHGAPREDAAAGSGGADGTRVGAYRLLSELGRGGQAVVHLAEDTRIGRQVALKVLTFGMGVDGDLPRRMKREAEAAARLDHPGLCQVFEAGMDGDVAYIAMRFVPGRTYAARLRDEPTPRTREERDDRLRILEECSRALAVAHAAGIVHRDVKPSNVMLKEDRDPVVLDFGVARDIESDTHITRTGDIVGTLGYVAPERLGRRGADTDGRVDVWSLGVMLYESMYGRRPFDAPTTEQLIQSILNDEPEPPGSVTGGRESDLRVVIETALAKDPAHRYRGALELAEDLRRLRAGEPVLARPVGPLTRAARLAARHRALSTLVLSLIVTLGAGLLASTHFWRETQDRLTEVTRLSDLTVLDELSRDAEALWPCVPEKVSGKGGMDDWLARARDVTKNRDLHRGALAALEARAGPAFTDPRDRWWRDQLNHLLAGLDALEKTTADVERRRDFALKVDRVSIDERRAEWDAAIARIESSPDYHGLRIRPQRGLVPVGPDPLSKFEEFAHVQSGAVPARDAATGKLVIDEASAIVLVLLPGGTFRMGADHPSASHPLGSANVDPSAGDFDGPAHDVTLDPFFVSKFELTQAQWVRMNGDNPSVHQRGGTWGVLDRPDLHPVERVSWLDATAVMQHIALQLPTEAQWEYAARGGTHTVWFTGDDKTSIRGFVNVADLATKAAVQNVGGAVEDWLDDGHARHAPIGTYLPNPFGLYDVLGNVQEWCREAWETYGEVPPRPGDGLRFVEGKTDRLVRGGAFTRPAVAARCAARTSFGVDARDVATGVRPSRAVE